jgi:hypothetical protein
MMGEDAEMRLQEQRALQRSLQRNEAAQVVKADIEHSRPKDQLMEAYFEEDPPVASRTMLRVERTFSFLSAFVPKRLADEQIGDALELMAEHLERSTALWPIYRLLMVTVFWVLVNALRDRVATMLSGPIDRKKTPGE